MSNAILVGIVGLVLFLQEMVRPSPALAVSAAECEAWLCLPGGFSGSECAPARQVVDRRLNLGINPIPTWSSCAPLYSAPPAVLALQMGDEYLPRFFRLLPGTYSLPALIPKRHFFPLTVRWNANNRYFLGDPLNFAGDRHGRIV